MYIPQSNVPWKSVVSKPPNMSCPPLNDVVPLRIVTGTKYNCETRIRNTGIFFFTPSSRMRIRPATPTSAEPYSQRPSWLWWRPVVCNPFRADLLWQKDVRTMHFLIYLDIIILFDEVIMKYPGLPAYCNIINVNVIQATDRQSPTVPEPHGFWWPRRRSDLWHLGRRWTRYPHWESQIYCHFRRPAWAEHRWTWKCWTDCCCTGGGFLRNHTRQVKVRKTNCSVQVFILNS